MKKLKILYVVPVEASIPGSDLGGVIPSSEQFMQGFRELGHEATFVRLRNVPMTGQWGTPSRAIYGPDQWTTGPGTGLPMHTVLGWQGPYLTTGNKQSLQEFIDLANAHDVVVWGALFGFKNKYAQRDTSWARCFTDVKTPTVVMIRDDHLWERQAWTSQVEPYINGWAPVHSCGFDLSAGLTKPRGIVFSTHDLSKMVAKPKPLSKRGGLYMVQNFKSWKRSERMVAASYHLNKMGRNVTLAGNGIELRYMMAEDKCKPRYIYNRHNDPDIDPSFYGQRMWAVAEKQPNFKYLGAQTEAQRDASMASEAFLVDLSERHNTGMFNRVFIEAALQGQVTMALEMFMSGVDGDNPLWQPGVHYLPVAPYSSPRELAEQMNAGFGMSDKNYRGILDNVREKLPLFDRKVGAQSLIDLALGKKPKHTLAYDKGGKGDAALIAKGRQDLIENFGDIL